MKRDQDERILRGMQIMGNILMPLMLLGLLLAALIDWALFNIMRLCRRHRM